MYLFYVDESGDSGYKKSMTKAFALSALVIRDCDWLVTLNEMIKFRRFLRDAFGIRLRDELKASALVQGQWPFKHIAPETRLRIFRQALRLQPKLGTVKVFAIVIDKEKLVEQGRTNFDPKERAWQFLVDRMERFTTDVKETAMLIPDEGHQDFIKTILRKKRRFSYVPSHFSPGSSLSRPASLIIEDPVSRSSRDNYFIQLADLNFSFR